MRKMWSLVLLTLIIPFVYASDSELALGTFGDSQTQIIGLFGDAQNAFSGEPHFVSSSPPISGPPTPANITIPKQVSVNQTTLEKVQTFLASLGTTRFALLVVILGGLIARWIFLTLANKDKVRARKVFEELIDLDEEFEEEWAEEDGTYEENSFLEWYNKDWKQEKHKEKFDEEIYELKVKESESPKSL